MSTKKTTYITLLLLVLLAFANYVAATNLPSLSTDKTLGSGYFPILLSIILFVLCVIKFIQNQRNEDKTINIPNLKIILATIGITIMFFLSFQLIGYFYINTFFYIFILLTFYKPVKKVFWFHLTIALATTIIIYFLFDTLLNIRF